MNEPVVRDAVQVEEVAHQSLLVGRLLLLNWADIAQVEAAVARFAAAFGCEAHLMVIRGAAADDRRRQPFQYQDRFPGAGDEIRRRQGDPPIIRRYS